mmetsp:Transcript_34966/g.62857  ORF Transcript_34966/g.62857 Transcript_34966/m.62857 type:complete len:549 (+) Transcript_34966:488-2134(+)
MGNNGVRKINTEMLLDVLELLGEGKEPELLLLSLLKGDLILTDVRKLELKELLRELGVEDLIEGDVAGVGLNLLLLGHGVGEVRRSGSGGLLSGPLLVGSSVLEAVKELLDGGTGAGLEMLDVDIVTVDNLELLLKGSLLSSNLVGELHSLLVLKAVGSVPVLGNNADLLAEEEIRSTEGLHLGTKESAEGHLGILKLSGLLGSLELKLRGGNLALGLLTLEEERGESRRAVQALSEGLVTLSNSGEELLVLGRDTLELGGELSIELIKRNNGKLGGNEKTLGPELEKTLMNFSTAGGNNLGSNGLADIAEALNNLATLSNNSLLSEALGKELRNLRGVLGLANGGSEVLNGLLDTLGKDRESKLALGDKGSSVLISDSVKVLDGDGLALLPLGDSNPGEGSRSLGGSGLSLGLAASPELVLGSDGSRSAGGDDSIEEFGNITSLQVLSPEVGNRVIPVLEGAGIVVLKERLRLSITDVLVSLKELHQVLSGLLLVVPLIDKVRGRGNLGSGNLLSEIRAEGGKVGAGLSQDSSRKLLLGFLSSAHHF